MAERYPELRRAQREGGPHRQGETADKNTVSVTNILAAMATVGAITWFATPTLQRMRQTSTKSSAEIEAVEKSVYYAGCNEARDAGVAPIYRGSPGYRSGMDGDNDGIACEPAP